MSDGFQQTSTARRLSARARLLLPALLLCAGALSAVALARGREEPALSSAGPAPPLVRVQAVPRQSIELVVRTRGVVAPRTESDLVPEVAGRVVRISPALAVGGFFEAGDVLVEIDDREYRSAHKRARASLARARSEARLAASNLARLRALADSDVVSPAGLDEAVSRTEVQNAAVTEAEANVEDAERNLDRTRLRAPYAGRVHEKWVDIGQVATPSTPVARIYAVDYAEVRLPIRDTDLAFLDFPLGAQSADEEHSPAVVLSANFAGARRHWDARIVRAEGQLDSRTRMVYLVARIEDPFGRKAFRDPLALGIFVDAEIEGRVVESVQRIPRAAVREGNQILVVDAEGRLRTRTLEVIRVDGESVVTAAIVAEDELLCLSDRSTLVDGMRVRTRLEAASDTPLAGGPTRSAP